MSTIFAWYSLFTIIISVVLIALWLVNGPSILAAGEQDGVTSDSASLTAVEAGSGDGYGATVKGGSRVLQFHSPLVSSALESNCSHFNWNFV